MYSDLFNNNNGQFLPQPNRKQIKCVSMRSHVVGKNTVYFSCTNTPLAHTCIFPLTFYFQIYTCFTLLYKGCHLSEKSSLNKFELTGKAPEIILYIFHFPTDHEYVFEPQGSPTCKITNVAQISQNQCGPLLANTRCSWKGVNWMWT